uniref:G-protein coupled receptors family 1 profile domain-containing protein n=1 Tax=Esox lucius TaxID=8010 RepID=A0A3P8Y5V7_ESOLU
MEDSITIYGYDEYGDYYNYTYDNVTGNGEVAAFQTHTTCFTEVSWVFYLVVNVLIFLFGVLGNGLVIWIAGLKMKRTVSTTWYLSLAMSDFILCLFIAFNIVYTVTKNWTFGLCLCKFNSFVMFFNMFSSIFILAVISVDRCVSVVFAVWAQNNCTNGKASVVVFLAWISSVALSLPSAVFTNVKTNLGRSLCYNNYSDQHSHKMIAVSRFIGGFAMPFLVIFFCYSTIIVQLRTRQMMRKSTKPLRVMTTLIVTFFISWLPYHVFILLELNQKN